jgi:hypothetical protein
MSSTACLNESHGPRLFLARGRRPTQFRLESNCFMEFSQLIKERKSIRGYQQKPVPRELIAEIIEVAKWAPSSMNTQPW